MQRADKIVIGTAIPFIVVVVAAAIVVLLYVKPCPSNQKYDSSMKACRTKCVKEGSRNGQKFDTKSQQCVCPDAIAPMFDPVTQECVGVCDVGMIWNPATRSCDRVEQQCWPPPSVNSMTGRIVDGTHFPTQSGSCGSGTTQQLKELCQAASCNHPQYCRAGDRWDGVSANGLECYKTQVCGLLPCDAPYCTTDTVQLNVGKIMKVSDSNNNCVNPTENAVGSMCTSDPTHAWKAPQCYSNTPLNTLQLTVTSASTDAGKGIVGTVQHGLVNGPVDLGADGQIMYKYTLSAPAAFRINNRLTQLQANDADVSTGAVLVTGVCAATDPAGVCYTFQIDNDEIRRLPSATYVLRLTGYPSWDVTLPLYVTGQPQGFTLSGSSVVPGALKQLDVSFNKDAALTVANDTLILTTKLVDLQRTEGSHMTNNPTVKPPTKDEITTVGNAVVMSCQSGFCRTDETITRKLVIVAWRPLPLDKYALEGICPGGGKVIKYYLARSHTETRGGETVVVDETLIGPTLAQMQPSETEIKTGTVSFVDLVDVNTVYTYKLAAYLADSAESTLEYRNAKCFGTLREMLVSVGRYTAAACHSIMYGVENSLPPYMTLTTAGTCAHDDSEPARDFYCLFDYTGGDKTTKGLDTSHMALSSNNQCYPILKMYPGFSTNQWDSRFATTASTASCIQGQSQNVVVQCPEKLKLQTVADQLSKSDLQARLQTVYDNFDMYNYDPAFAASKEQLNVADVVVEGQRKENPQLTKLYDTYAYCPVKSNPDYGYYMQYDTCISTFKPDDTKNLDWCKNMFRPSACEKDDKVCNDLLDVSNCKYNVCSDWKQTAEYEYTRNRRAFFNDKLPDASAKCCNGQGSYQKGVCKCNDTRLGQQCSQDTCATQFARTRAENFPDCTPEYMPINEPALGVCHAKANFQPGDALVQCDCNSNAYPDPNNPYLCLPKDRVTTMQVTYQTFKGNGSKGDTYRVIPVGTFVSYHNKFVVDGDPKDAIRLEIGDGSGEHDQAELSLYVFKGTLDGFPTNQKTASLPPNPVVASKVVSPWATIKRDVQLNVLNSVTGWTEPNPHQIYTVAIVIKFPNKYGTDNSVRVFWAHDSKSPNLTIRTTNS